MKVKGTLSLCSLSALQFGTWQLNKTLPIDYVPWRECPRFYLAPNKLPFLLKEHADKYSCPCQQYKISMYNTDECVFSSVADSIRIINDHVKLSATNSLTTRNSTFSITYIGDSLMGQIVFAAKCMQEHLATPRFNINVIWDIFLRNDIPCDDRCITDAKFLHQPGFFHPCWGCRDGKRANFSEFLNSPLAWYNRIPNDTNYVVLSTGAWYNSFRSFMNSTATFIETIQAIAPLLHNLKEQRGITTYWLGLPPYLSEEEIRGNKRRLVADWLMNCLFASRVELYNAFMLKELLSLTAAPTKCCLFINSIVTNYFMEKS